MSNWDDAQRQAYYARREAGFDRNGVFVSVCRWEAFEDADEHRMWLLEKTMQRMLGIAPRKNVVEKELWVRINDRLMRIRYYRPAEMSKRI